MKKRLPALLLAAAMLLPSFAGCSEKSAEEKPETGTETASSAEAAAAEPAEEEAVEEEPALSDDLPDTNFDGAPFRILSCLFHGDQTYKLITYEELTGVPITDALYESNCYVEDRFNVSIEWTDGGSDGAARDKVAASFRAGDNSWELHLGHDRNTVGLGKSGYLRNLYDIDQFNFEKPWWPKNTVQSWTLNGKMYAASSYLSYNGIAWTRAIAVNKDWAGDLGMTVPYDLVREGGWTLDRLNEMTKDVTMDVNGDGRIASGDRLGFITGTETWYCLQEAVDIPMYRHQPDGGVAADFDIDKIDRLLNIMRTICAPDHFFYDGSTGISVFQQGQALFAYTEIGDVYNYCRDVDMLYGFLPTPKMDEAQADYINCCTDAPWGIPALVQGDQADLAGTVIEAMSCFNYQHVIPAYFDVALKSRAADSPDDSEMLQLIADTRTIGFAYGYDLPMHSILEDILETSLGAASYVAKREKGAVKLMEKLVESFSEME